MSLIPNELLKYASVNYIWTLAVLSTTEINTASYIDSVPNTIVLRSGGYTKKGEIITKIESSIGVNFEYFVDDIHIDSLYTPNPRSGMTTATKIDFKVTEPYSVGLFLQTLTLAAMANGYSDAGFSNVPLLMRCEFIGYDSSGKVIEMITRDLALKLINVTFTVDAGGSVYQVEAIAWPQQALGDDVQVTKTDSKFYGTTVEEILSVGPRSLTAYLNKAETDLVTSKSKTYANEYLIEFPDSLGSYTPTSAYGPGTSAPGSLPAAKQSYGPGTARAGSLPAAPPTSNRYSEPRMVNHWDTKQRKIDASLREYGFPAQTGMLVGSTPASSVPAPSPKIVASSSGSVAGTPRAGINIIGTSTVNTDLNYMGNQEFALDSFALDPATGTYKNDFLTLGVDRSFIFKQGTKIEDMITQVILTSNFTRDVIAKLETNTDQPLTWFRIETETLMKNPQGQMQYIYKVIPYSVDRSLFEKNGVPKTYDSILAGVTKGYNYVYTGLNSEVLNFDISINSAFFQMFARGANNTNNQVPSASGVNPRDLAHFLSSMDVTNGVTNNNSVSGKNVSVPDVSKPAQTLTDSTENGPNGSGIVDSRALVANQFQKIILNGNVELINIELEVMGDPYFLPDSGMGNHVTNRGMSYQRAEVDIIIHFNTPVDYKNGLMAFSSLDSFVGLYKILQVSHTFQNGQFKQTINMLRRPNQDEKTLAAAKALLVEKAIGQQIPNLQEVIMSGTKNTAPLIYSLLSDGSSGLPSLLTKVLAFQNIENILPMPKDLLSAFSSITKFGASVTSVTAGLQSLYGGSAENLVKNFSTNLVKSMTSNLQNTVSSITKPFSQLSASLGSFTDSLSNPSFFTSQITKNATITPANTVAPPKIPPGDPTKTWTV
jgi:hypothetical protein